MELILALITGLVVVAIWASLRTRHRKLPYPPGPRPRWLVGNLFDMPTVSPWLRFSEWDAIYGDVIYVQVLGKPIVILNSLAASKELLEKRGATSSARPAGIMHELINQHRDITSQQDVPFWRYQRRLVHAAFGPQIVQKYYQGQEAHAARFLQKMLDPSADCKTELRLSIGRVIFELTYGLPVEEHFKEYNRMSDIILRAFLEAVIPGKFLVETIPVLRYVPSWLPGAGFKRRADVVSKISEEHATVYFEAVKRAWHAGTAPASLVANGLDTLVNETASHKLPLPPSEAEEALMWAASTMYLAGIDTTLAKFLTAMQLYPDVQRKAQEELDRVVGPDRLPNTDDKHALPYLNALIKEVMRWHPGVATGIPHRLTQDEVYRGYLIPKDSTVLSNAWHMTRHTSDGRPIDQPDDFIPERFLDARAKDLPDPSEIVFGFGRRVCPGRYVAEGTIFFMISSMLATYRISKPIDGHGNEVRFEVEWTGSDINSYPNPMRPRFTPRSAAALDLIKRAADAAQ